MTKTYCDCCKVEVEWQIRNPKGSRLPNKPTDRIDIKVNDMPDMGYDVTRCRSCFENGPPKTMNDLMTEILVLNDLPPDGKVTNGQTPLQYLDGYLETVLDEIEDKLI